jgi:hypothetical protein
LGLARRLDSVADEAWEKFADRPEICGAVYRRTVKS